MKKILDFLLNNLALIGFIAMLDALGWLFVSGNYRAFLHPRFWPLLIIAAAILCGFVVAAVLGYRNQHSGGARMNTAVHTAILIMPLLIMYSVVGQGLGAQALSQKYTGNELDALSVLSPKKRDAFDPDRTNGLLSLLDIAGHLKQLNGRQLATEGQVYRDSAVPPNYLLLYRFAMFCCAADAFPVWVLVEKENLENFNNDHWIEVNGRLELTTINGKDIPVIKASNIVLKELPSPGLRYLYF